MPFTCRACGCKTQRLVASKLHEDAVCPTCCPPTRISPIDLHEVVAQAPDGTGRVTRGKAWEIDNRRTAPDGTVFNVKTGKEAQY